MIRREQLVLGHAVVAPRRRLGHDLLGEDVERLLGRVEGVEASPLDRGQQRGALDQLVPGGRVHDPPGNAGAVVVGPAHPLEEGGDAVGRADLAHQLDRPDVDAELQRGGRHQRAQVAGPQAVLDPLAALPRERPVMGGHLVLSEPLAQLVGHPLGELSGVDEDERGPVVGDVGGDPVEDLVELVARDGRLELAVGQLQRQLEAAPVPAVDDRRERLAAPTSRRAAVSSGLTVAERPIRTGGRSVTAWSRSSERVRCEPRLSRASAWISSTITVSTVRERRPGPLGGQVQVERLGRGDEEVRRAGGSSSGARDEVESPVRTATVIGAGS